MTDPANAERLETGWFPDTPADDTVIRQYVLATGEWVEAVARASGAPVLRTDDVVITDEHSAHVLFNTGILLRPVTPERAEAVEMHGVPAERVLVTGAQCYDQWWERRPSRSREAFCRRVGLGPDRIDAAPPCTHCEVGRFFSYRRDGGETGQHVSFIWRRS